MKEKMVLMLLKMLLNQGLIGEFKKLETTIQIPMENSDEGAISITIKAEHVSVTIVGENLKE